MRDSPHLSASPARKASLLVALVLAAALALTALVVWRQRQIHVQEQAFIDAQLSMVVRPRQQAAEALFNGLYQNLRTISLLPSVRGVPGTNRANESEDIVASGRFTREGRETVQQIYNNLRSNVNVSEVYGVLDGLDAGKGQVPLFMFDTLLFGEAKPEAEAATTADTPEESEADEYAYFPTQMATIRQAHGEFHFDDLDQIPAYLSPLMRTCDNAQYLSKARGDVSETLGFLYSVPFYQDQGKQFRGVISGIVRRNVLEALLLGTPFVAVTDADQTQQQKAGWATPQASRFMLTNGPHKIQILDRRSPELPSQLAQGVEGRNVFRVPLNVHSDSPWVLSYYLPESMIQDALRDSQRAFVVLVVIVLLVLTAAVVSLTLLGGIRSSVQEIGQVFGALSQGNLTRRMQGRHKGLLAQLKRDSDHTIQRLNGILRQIHTATQTLTVTANEIASGSLHINERTQGQSASLRDATLAATDLAQRVADSASRAQDANQHAHSASEVAVACGQVVGEVVHTMEAINRSSVKIEEIIAVIDGIAFQTNILALNAAVEAARAGEQGRGFAVVASEVRSLAQRSAAAAKQIKDLIQASVSQVAEGSALVARAGQTMGDVVKSIQSTTALMAQITDAANVQSQGIARVQSAIQTIEGSTHSNLELVAQAAAGAQSLEALAQGLETMVSAFRLEPGALAEG